MLGERSKAKSYHPNRIVDQLEKSGLFFLIFSMVLGLLDQLQIFSVESDRIARAFKRSGTT